MTEYTPDNWVIIKIKPDNEDSFYKVLGGWSGGYLYGDSWRMNSGITKVDFDGEYYHFAGESGSVYKCHKSGNEMRMSISGVWATLQEKFPDQVELVSVDSIKL